MFVIVSLFVVPCVVWCVGCSLLLVLLMVAICGLSFVVVGCSLVVLCRLSNVVY